MSDDVMVVAAPLSSAAPQGAIGAAYIYRCQGLSWQLEATFSGDSSETSFGLDVSISGEIAAVMEYEFDGESTLTNIHIYRWDGFSWSYESGPRVDSYVADLAISGDSLVVGDSTLAAERAIFFRWNGLWCGLSART